MLCTIEWGFFSEPEEHFKNINMAAGNTVRQSGSYTQTYGLQVI